jgi:hypothetical protein
MELTRPNGMQSRRISDGLVEMKTSKSQVSTATTMHETRRRVVVR